jgi:transcriptional regulator with XRE-family HTH domain
MGRSARLRPTRLADKLLQIRLALGLSQNDMLRHLGFDEILYRSNVSGFELGEREPPLPVLLEYAKVAGVCLDVLVDDKLDLPDKLPGTPKHNHEGTPNRVRRKRES